MIERSAIVSSIKNPEEKKLLSLKRDCRNTYGENAKSSRKNISLSKRLGMKSARSTVNQVLSHRSGSSSDLDLDQIEELTVNQEIRGRQAQFWKSPDTPLFAVLLKKKTKREWDSIPTSPDTSIKMINSLRQELRRPR